MKTTGPGRKWDGVVFASMSAARKRNTIILVVIALALGAYIVFFEMRKDATMDVETPEADPDRVQ